MNTESSLNMKIQIMLQIFTWISFLFKSPWLEQVHLEGILSLEWADFNEKHTLIKATRNNITLFIWIEHVLVTFLKRKWRTQINDLSNQAHLSSTENNNSSFYLKTKHLRTFSILKVSSTLYKSMKGCSNW